MNRFCFQGAEKNLRSFRSRGFQVRALIAAISALFWMGCNRAAKSSSVVTVAFESMPRPAGVGTITVDFTLADAAAKPVVGAQLNTEADMTHAGMSPVFGTLQEKQPGRYESKLNLGMAGDWVILLHGTLPTGEKLERQFELRDVRPN
jgi:YtkA-like